MGVGQVPQALMAIDEALAQCDRTDERWNMAELPAYQGRAFLLEGTPEATAALGIISCKPSTGRATGSIVPGTAPAHQPPRPKHEHERTGEAHELLSAVYHRFTRASTPLT